jgi:hypothetical protein
VYAMLLDSLISLTDNRKRMMFLCLLTFAVLC